jgi:hypothetical protein
MAPSRAPGAPWRGRLGRKAPWPHNPLEPGKSSPRRNPAFAPGRVTPSNPAGAIRFSAPINTGFTIGAHNSVKNSKPENSESRPGQALRIPLPWRICAAGRRTAGRLSEVSGYIIRTHENAESPLPGLQFPIGDLENPARFEAHGRAPGRAHLQSDRQANPQICPEIPPQEAVNPSLKRQHLKLSLACPQNGGFTDARISIFSGDSSKGSRDAELHILIGRHRSIAFESARLGENFRSWGRVGSHPMIGGGCPSPEDAAAENFPARGARPRPSIRSRRRRFRSSPACTKPTFRDAPAGEISNQVTP